MATVPQLPKSFEDAKSRHFEVESELERICSAVHFRTSKRACEFLRYVVRVTLDGRLDSLKERSIGIDLLGRDISYDPSSDAIVRVRANDVRKRLTSYYASPELTSKIQIYLPLGTYIPSFIPHEPADKKMSAFDAIPVPKSEIQEAASIVPPLGNMALMRPALLALLLCVLLMRHQLEDRESYLRFWDHILSGRNVLIFSISPQEQANLAPSLYPIVWIAGRYGVDTALEGSVPSDMRPEQLASVEESLITPPALARDKRLRWVLSEQSKERPITDLLAHDQGRMSNVSSAALLTVLPEDSATLYIEGTDSETIKHLLDDMTSQRYFPDGITEELGSGNPLQVLLLQTTAGQWQTKVFYGDGR